MGERRAFLEEWFDRVWSAGDRAAIYDLLAPDATVMGLEEEKLTGTDQFALFHTLAMNLVRDIEIRVLVSVEEGDWVAALLEFQCIHRESGQPLRSRGHMMCRIVGGKLVEGHNLFDMLSVFEQMGLLPQRTLDQLLLGQQPKFAGPVRNGGKTAS